MFGEPPPEMTLTVELFFSMALAAAPAAPPAIWNVPAGLPPAVPAAPQLPPAPPSPPSVPAPPSAPAPPTPKALAAAVVPTCETKPLIAECVPVSALIARAPLPKRGLPPAPHPPPPALATRDDAPEFADPTPPPPP